MVSSAVQCVHCTKVASNVLYQEMALVCGTPVVSSAVHCTKVARNVLYQEMALVCGTPVVIACCKAYGK